MVLLPIVQCGPWVLAALDFDHEQREEQEEHGHAKANTVHSLVANQNITVHVTLHTGNRRAHPSFTKPWNLREKTAESKRFRAAPSNIFVQKYRHLITLGQKIGQQLKSEIAATLQNKKVIWIIAQTSGTNLTFSDWTVYIPKALVSSCLLTVSSDKMYIYPTRILINDDEA